jgi:hypothetical protein
MSVLYQTFVECVEDWTLVQFEELSDLAGQLKLDFDAIIAEVEQEKKAAEESAMEDESWPPDDDSAEDTDK